MSDQSERLLALARNVLQAANDAGWDLVLLADVDLRAVFNGRCRWVACIGCTTWTGDTPEQALEGLAARMRGPS